MRHEIEFFRKKLLPNSGIHWESPIAHIIPRMSTFITFGDSCLKGAREYSLSLGFWWHLPFPEEVKLHTLLHKQDNSDGWLISINVLEFVTVIFNYCAALHMVLSTNPTNDPYPVLLNVTNNASTLSWTASACRKSRIGRLLVCFFCMLLINSTLGINSQWISTIHMLSLMTFLMQRMPLHIIPTHTPCLTIHPSNRSTRSWVTALSSGQC